MAADRVGAPPRAWQRMLSGRRLDLLDPSPLDVEIADIAQGLARVARWNGQTGGDHAFSVAQHSLLVEDIFSFLDARPLTRCAVDRAAARRAGICHRRHDLALQVGSRRRLQGRRAAAATGDPSAVRPSGRDHGETETRDQAGGSDRRLFRGDAACRIFDRGSDAVLRPSAGISPDRFDLACKPAKTVQAAFLKRFAGLEKLRA